MEIELTIVVMIENGRKIIPGIIEPPKNDALKDICWICRTQFINCKCPRSHTH